MNKPRRRKYVYQYPRPALTVDLILVSRKAPLKVLLIRRAQDPFAGRWALPGGFVDEGETLEEAARRELMEETGVTVKTLEQLHAFGNPGRDPRGWVVAVAHITRIDPDSIEPNAADDAAEVGWHPLSRLPSLAFDHADILAHARRWLKKNAPASKR